MKKISIILLAFLCIFQVYPVQAAVNSDLAHRLSGRFLVAVAGRGEAWFVNPVNQRRYDLGLPSNAMLVLRAAASGITDADLAKIPLATLSLGGTDTDGDGLPDSLETAIGTKINNTDSDSDGYSDKIELANNYNPLGPGKLPIDLTFVNRVKGRIFLQVQSHGEIWYVNPQDSRRYLISSPSAISILISKFGLGISNANLAQIQVYSLTSVIVTSPTVSTPLMPKPAQVPVATNTPYDLSYLEQKINQLINAERAKNGLPALVWNSDVAAVAREHSQNLARDNQSLTSLNKVCDYFLIHHEGMDFGLYQNDRLNNRGIYYFSSSGENISMQGGKKFVFLSTSIANDQDYIDQCTAAVDSANNAFKDRLESDISTQDKLNLIVSEVATRKAELAAEGSVTVVSTSYLSNDEMAANIVTGWMNSPGHRANILRAEYNQAGIGVAYVNGYIISTQDFITKVSCGYKGGECCASNACYLPNICQKTNICQ